MLCHCCPTNVRCEPASVGHGSGERNDRPFAAGMRQSSAQGWVYRVSVVALAGFTSGVVAAMLKRYHNGIVTCFGRV